MDRSFVDLVSRHPQLNALGQYLPPAAVFDGASEINLLQSSYAARRYGALLYALIRVLKPLSAVETGIFRGFSLLSAAAALRDNGAGHITGYDLFEAYPYRHADREQVSRQIVQSGLERWVTIEARDLKDVPERWEAVDYLHVDVSNNGGTFRTVFDQWSHKVRQIILLEGGSAERDNVAWMHQYQKPAIAPALADLRRAHPDWSFTTLEPFPSLTVACHEAAFAAPSAR